MRIIIGLLFGLIGILLFSRAEKVLHNGLEVMGGVIFFSLAVMCLLTNLSI